MIKKRNKRAQELSTNSIVVIILAVIVLVVLIFGFTRGWDQILPWLSSSNIESVSNQCDVACNLQNSYDYCQKERELRADDLPTGEKTVEGTCEFFSSNQLYSKYGIKECEAIKCEDLKVPCEDLALEGYNIALSDSCSGDDKRDLSASASNVVKTDAETNNNYCCATKI